MHSKNRRWRRSYNRSIAPHSCRSPRLQAEVADPASGTGVSNRLGSRRAKAPKLERKSPPGQCRGRDHGVGVRAETLERLFKPFNTSKPRGLGMGLSISRSIIVAHGDRLWTENNPGGGATFSFSLPRRSMPRPGSTSLSCAPLPGTPERVTSGTHELKRRNDLAAAGDARSWSRRLTGPVSPGSPRSRGKLRCRRSRSP